MIEREGLLQDEPRVTGRLPLVEPLGEVEKPLDISGHGHFEGRGGEAWESTALGQITAAFRSTLDDGQSLKKWYQF